jgi:hypothetical protein
VDNFGHSRSLGWDLFHLVITVMAYLVAAGALAILLLVVGLAHAGRWLWSMRSSRASV